MKAVVLYGKEDVRVGEFPLRQVGPGEVKIAVAYCGICGTDFHKTAGRAGSRPVRCPVPLGHEISGYVSELGDGVEGLRVGDAVTADPNHSCGRCDYCRMGKPSFCRHATGVVKGMAEYVVAPAENVYRLPDGMDMRLAALAEPLSCCLRGMDLLGLMPGETAALVGFGAIGALMLRLMQDAGAARVLVVEPNETRRALALKQGAAAAVSPTDTEALRRCAEEWHLSRVMECAGSSAAQQTALEIADRGATVVLFGVSAAEDRLSLSVYEAFLKELVIKTSYINPHTTQRAIDLLAEKPWSAEEIFSAELSMEEAAEELLHPAHSRRGKVLVKIGPR